MVQNERAPRRPRLCAAPCKADLSHRSPFFSSPPPSRSHGKRERDETTGDVCCVFAFTRRRWDASDVHKVRSEGHWIYHKKGFSKVIPVLKKGSNTYLAAILSCFPLQLFLFYRSRIPFRLRDLWLRTDMIWKPTAASIKWLSQIFKNLHLTLKL